ncbi:MAG TPA: hypothetical protein VKV32_03500, partial [Stellaceae bacterium]|nr:hypothetical protein [Stellaceae bacterium]
MRVFRVERSLVALLLIFLGTPVRAQTGAPTPLFPPSASAAPPSAAPPPPSAPMGDAAIQSEPLAPVAPVWGGTLGAADRALPHDMWSTTPRSFVDAALPLLEPTTSPVLQNLAHRLLLSNAIMPHGSDPAGGPDLLERRLDSLLTLGMGDGAALLDAIFQNTASEGFDRDAVELRITAGDLAGACKMVADRVAHYRDPWWDQALVACQALTGAYDQAALGLNAMREQKSGRDPVFETLIDAILGHRARLEKLPNPTPLRVALLAATKLPAPADALANAGPAALAVWATSDKVPVAARLVAGEKAEAFGALPPAGLGLLYSAVPFRPEEQGALLKSGKLPDDPRSRAILYNLARTSEPGAMRVAALAPLIADARRRGDLVSMARLVGPLVAELQPSPEWQSFAGDAARVLLAVRAYDRAAPWVELAGRPELRVIAGFAASGEDSAPPPLGDAAAALTALDPKAAPRQTDLLFSLAAALGEPVAGIDIAP